MTLLAPKLTTRDLAGALDWIDRVTVLLENGELGGGVSDTPAPEPTITTTLNPPASGLNIAFTDGNHRATKTTSNAWQSAFANVGVSTDLRYCEVTAEAGVGGWGVGVAVAGFNKNTYPGGDAFSVGYLASGDVNTGGSTILGLSAWNSVGNVLCVCFNGTTRKIWWRIGASGDWNDDPTADPATDTGGIALGGSLATGDLYLIIGLFTGTGTPDSLSVNFGADTFFGSPPTGAQLIQ